MKRDETISSKKMGQEEYAPVQEVRLPSLFHDVGSDGRNDLFNIDIEVAENL